MSVRIAGTPGAPGIAIGPVWRYAASNAGSEGPVRIAPGDAPAAIRAASEEAARQLEELTDRVRKLGREDDAGIFDAQALMATDPGIVDEAIQRAEAGEDPVAAVEWAAEASAQMLAALPNELLAARAADVRDVGARIARILRGEKLSLPDEPSIAIADDLPPSVTAEIPAGFLLGIALEGGSRTAHAVILARGLGIPAIVGARGLVAAVGPAAGAKAAPLRAAMDGSTGEILLAPDEGEVADLRGRATAAEAVLAGLVALRDRPGATADGERVILAANIGTPDDAPRALAAGAEGVGLFRTEFLFMRRQRPPTETEQVGAYRRVLEAFGPARPVVIRLADIGGDKAIPYLGLPAEANPFLGVRAIRLAYPGVGKRDLLLTQLRSIWRAGALAKVVPQIMAPMVGTMADVRLLIELRDEARADVIKSGEPCAERLVTGIMVEVPSAAVLAGELAQYVDFFSIGTNDLTQYVMAADRGNAALGELQDALQPAVLRMISSVVGGADRSGIPVAVCGELAGDPLGALVLVAIGVDELSADAASLDGIRSALAGVTRAQLDQLAQEVLVATDVETVRDLAGRLLTGVPAGRD
jgi:phosphoenolpyruvate-protein phosphotransferase